MLGLDPKVARSAWTYAVVFTAVLLSICAVWVIRKTLLAFATALLLAYLLYPLVEHIDRRMPWRTRTPALAMPFVLVLGFLTAFGLVIKDPLQTEYAKLHSQITQTGFRQKVKGFKLLELPIGEHILNTYSDSQIVGMIPEFHMALRTASRYSVNLFIIPILSFLILKDGKLMRDSLLELFDSERRAESLLRDAHVLLLDYMRALLFLCLATLMSFSVVLSFMRVPYAILLALAAFALEFIPVVGWLTAAILIISVATFTHYPYLPWLVIFLITYRFFQDYVLSPHLMRGAVKLHPLLVLFGVFAGAEIGGIPGIFLSVPALALLRLLLYEWRKRSDSPRTTVAARSLISLEPVGLAQ